MQPSSSVVVEVGTLAVELPATDGDGVRGPELVGAGCNVLGEDP